MAAPDPLADSVASAEKLRVLIRDGSILTNRLTERFVSPGCTRDGLSVFSAPLNAALSRCCVRRLRAGGGWGETHQPQGQDCSN